MNVLIAVYHLLSVINMSKQCGYPDESIPFRVGGLGYDQIIVTMQSLEHIPTLWRRFGDDRRVKYKDKKYN